MLEVSYAFVCILTCANAGWGSFSVEGAPTMVAFSFGFIAEEFYFFAARWTGSHYYSCGFNEAFNPRAMLKHVSHYLSLFFKP